VTFAALYLLQRLKTRFIAAHGSSRHRPFTPASMIASTMILTLTSPGASSVRVCLPFGKSTKMCSYLEPWLNVEPSVLKEFETVVQKDFEGSSLYLAHYNLPAPSSGPFAHPKPSTSNIPTTIPSFDPNAHPSPPSTTSLVPPEKLLRRLSVDSYLTPTDVPQLLTSPSSHSNVPSSANYEGGSTKIVSSRRVQHNADTGRQRLPTVPPCPHSKVFLTHTSTR
jgi:hypothetical protein